MLGEKSLHENKRSKLNKANLSKTYYYLRKNGIRAALNTVRERIKKGEHEDYRYEAPEEELLIAQKQHIWENPIYFSILVPVYETPLLYYKDMLESVLDQSYPYFQIVIADASKTHKLEEITNQYEDERISYFWMGENRGIAENTNYALEKAKNSYVGFLDHDDILTPDALFEMATVIENARTQGVELELLYSDEDKCDETGVEYYDVHKKKDFDLTLFLSNNYISHFTLVKTNLAQKLRLRTEYDGAQDYDFVLRAVHEILSEQTKIEHICKVLYHWRCHRNSTAVNPRSKQYAYESGKRAVESFLKLREWNAVVTHSEHLGYYKVEYQTDIMMQRPEVGAVGGKIINGKNKITGGMINENREVDYYDLPVSFSGYMNNAGLVQEAVALDIRGIRLNQECRSIFEDLFRIPYKSKADTEQFDMSTFPKEIDIIKASILLSQELKKAGYVLVWDPSWIIKV